MRNCDELRSACALKFDDKIVLAVFRQRLPCSNVLKLRFGAAQRFNVRMRVADSLLKLQNQTTTKIMQIFYDDKQIVCCLKRTA